MKSNKKDTFTYRQERNDMGGRIEAAEAAVKDVSLIGKALRRTVLRLNS